MAPGQLPGRLAVRRDRSLSYEQDRQYLANGCHRLAGCHWLAGTDRTDRSTRCHWHNGQHRSHRENRTCRLAFATGSLPRGDTQLVGGSYSGGSYRFDDPLGVAFDGSHIWVANAIGNSVTDVPAGP